MKFSFFHLMPNTGLAEACAEWPVPNRVFDAYVDIMIYAEQCGFDWIAT